VAAYQGSAVLTNALGQPEQLARQARRVERWIDTVDSHHPAKHDRRRTTDD
jgi:hypothetical protein